MMTQTTGTIIRPSHSVAGPAMTFDLANEVGQLRHEDMRLDRDRHAKTLVKEADFSIVLLCMEEGSVVRQHVVPAEIALHMLTGHLRLDTSDQQFDLLAGELAVLDRGVQFRLEAQRASSFTLTVARQALETLEPLTGRGQTYAQPSTEHSEEEAEIAKVTYRFLERRTPFLELVFQCADNSYYQRWIGERAGQFMNNLHITDPQMLEGRLCTIRVHNGVCDFLELR